MIGLFTILAGREAIPVLLLGRLRVGTAMLGIVLPLGFFTLFFAVLILLVGILLQLVVGLALLAGLLLLLPALGLTLWRPPAAARRASWRVLDALDQFLEIADHLLVAAAGLVEDGGYGLVLFHARRADLVEILVDRPHAVLDLLDQFGQPFVLTRRLLLGAKRT